MSLPALLADPAEVELAFAALHVVAAFVFLYGAFAVRAGLAVGDEPEAVGGVFAFGAGGAEFFRFDFGDFCMPLLPLSAAARSVGFAEAFPAEEVGIAAVDGVGRDWHWKWNGKYQKISIFEKINIFKVFYCLFFLAENFYRNSIRFILNRRNWLK